MNNIEDYYESLLEEVEKVNLEEGILDRIKGSHARNKTLATNIKNKVADGVDSVIKGGNPKTRSATNKNIANAKVVGYVDSVSKKSARRITNIVNKTLNEIQKDISKGFRNEGDAQQVKELIKSEMLTNLEVIINDVERRF